MEISINKFKHCNLVKIKGRIDSSTAPHLDDVLKSITENGEFNIVVDLGDVDFLSSAALRVLIKYQKLCRRYNRGEIVLAKTQENVFQALDLAGFTQLFKIFDEVVAAVGNF